MSSAQEEGIPGMRSTSSHEFRSTISLITPRPPSRYPTPVRLPSIRTLSNSQSSLPAPARSRSRRSRKLNQFLFFVQTALAILHHRVPRHRHLHDQLDVPGLFCLQFLSTFISATVIMEKVTVSISCHLEKRARSTRTLSCSRIFYTLEEGI